MGSLVVPQEDRFTILNVTLDPLKVALPEDSRKHLRFECNSKSDVHFRLSNGITSTRITMKKNCPLSPASSYFIQTAAAPPLASLQELHMGSDALTMRPAPLMGPAFQTYTLAVLNKF